MSRDERQQLRASADFDDGCLPSSSASLEELHDWSVWSQFAAHLAQHEIAGVPADFAQSVRRRLVRRRRWAEAKLVLGAALATGLILTFVVAIVLGLDWWHRLLTALSPTALLASLRLLPGQLASGLNFLELLDSVLRRILPLAPIALLAAGVAALFVQVALLRYLRLGPFSTSHQQTP